MDHSGATIGLVQIGEVVWERRPSMQFHIVDGALRPKPLCSNSMAASLAYLPHSAGVLQVYAQQHAHDAKLLRFLLPLYKRLPIGKAVDHLGTADIVGISVYVWNIQFSLSLARELKRRRPDVLIVMGGPQVPDYPEEFLRANRFIDVVCHGEGERTFVEILGRRHTRCWEGVLSTSYLTSGGRLIVNERRPRMTELDEIPSPMLGGVYEDLMQSEPEQQWLATWETNRGCPFACTFCDWGSATASKVSRYSESRLFDEIEWLADHRIHHLFMCDANFGMLSRDADIAERLVDAYRRRGMYVAISVQNTKNRTDRSEQIQRIFKQSGVVSFGASISLQSVDRKVLKAIKRDNISLDAFDSLQKHYAKEGLETYSDLILGLPEETYRSFTQGVGQVIRNGQFNRIAFYECSVLPNAPMAAPTYRESFQIETVPIRLVHAHEPLINTYSPHPEFIDIVVSTASMSCEEWVRARVFAYFAELLFFDRLLHVPLVLLGIGLGLQYVQLFEAFLDADPSDFPLTAATTQIFEKHVRSMLKGGPQYIPSEEWLSLWWPPDQYALIGLARGEALDAFYEEARLILTTCAENADADPRLVEDAVRLNRAMFALPFLLCDEEVETTYPIAEDYQAVLRGQEPILKPQPSACRVERSETVWMSWTDWCEDLVRRVFLRNYYLYPIKTFEPQKIVALPLREEVVKTERSLERSL
jgi:tRNA A37 methylthiotransferase MiaB